MNPTKMGGDELGDEDEEVGAGADAVVELLIGEDDVEDMVMWACGGNGATAQIGRAHV